MDNRKLIKLTRLSQKDRPKINEKCFFSPVIQLIDGVFIDDTRVLLHDYMKHNSVCTVTKHGNYIDHVKFGNNKHTDIVSPEFLLRMELTKQAKQLLSEATEGCRL